MQTLLAGAQAPTSSPTQEGEDPADPYLTVLTYSMRFASFGGARRISSELRCFQLAAETHRRSQLGR
ncbi:hypothetical protein [Mesorhizobium sp. M5C.F.Ca.IN.020.32.2.1]|uniref:hypothetical protein n=1 Tax=Mesorhizobium sp. M5C.F.Ca.IN.020.32.2.1 TaxID=2496771 RepID=UPI000FD33452|nr:hypothetical protein [Mesorhizobium sp. M5C.F.Ca.IN.020.32.2.1]RUV32956.1 hypothetical protein EOA86_00275 [Mesorhizobium sp. M5C.F.Ca.IN.020.32.2.1]